MDVSGSMGDEQKLEHAKAAALRLVDRLRPEDALSLVVFDDDARLLAEAGGSVRTIAAFLVTRHRLSRRAAYETAQRVMGG